MFHSSASLLVMVPDFILLEMSEFKWIHPAHGLLNRPSNNTNQCDTNLTLSHWSKSKTTYASLRRWYCSAHINFVDVVWLRVGPVTIKRIRHIFKGLIKLNLSTPNWRAYINENKTAIHLFPFPLVKLTVQMLLWHWHLLHKTTQTMHVLQTSFSSAIWQNLQDYVQKWHHHLKVKDSQHLKICSKLLSMAWWQAFNPKNCFAEKKIRLFNYTSNLPEY